MPTSKKRSSTTILGIDPGYADTGYGVIHVVSMLPQYVICDTISSARTMQFEQRILLLHTALNRIITQYKPKVIAIEKIFFFKNKKTAINVAQARGVVLLAAAQHKIPTLEYSPMEVKQSLTSYGQATKQQVAHMVEQLLKIPKLTQKDDAVDALAIALCASFRGKLVV